MTLPMIATGCGKRRHSQRGSPTTASMTSGHEASQVLLTVAATQKLSGEARDLYVSTAERLGDYEQGRTLTALVKSERR